MLRITLAYCFASGTSEVPAWHSAFAKSAGMAFWCIPVQFKSCGLNIMVIKTGHRGCAGQRPRIECSVVF